MKPLISIVIPTLNEEKILDRTLSALKGALTLPHEIVVSDGGSTDQTVAIARRYADVVVEHASPVRGTIAAGKNAGAKAAHGMYLVFIDGDIFIPETDAFFTRAVARFTENPRLVGLIVTLNVLPEYRTFADWFFSALFNTYNRVTNNVFRSPNAPGEFQMIPAPVFEKLGGYDERIVASEDMDMFIRLSRVGRTRFEASLAVLQTGRRAHAIGWPRLLATWIGNGISVKLRGRSMSKEWKVIR
jgi:glycosyltransferase involved in cell wall biosynthesis